MLSEKVYAHIDDFQHDNKFKPDSLHERHAINLIDTKKKERKKHDGNERE